MSATSERVRRIYRAERRKGTPARHALYVARGSVAFEELDYGPADYYTLTRDGIEFRVRVEFDHESYCDAVEADREQGWDGPTAPEWWVSIETADGTYRDSCGGIAGGYFGPRDDAEMDDEVRAYLWFEFINPACDPDAVRSAWVAVFV